MFVLAGARRFWRRYLLRRFQFNVQRHRSFLRQPIQPNSYDDVLFAVATYRFANTEAEFVAGIDALLNCKDDWKGCRAAVATAEAAMREAARLVPLMTCMMATGKEQPSALSAPALVSLTGWANTKVKSFPSIEKGTAEEFVGSVRIALAEYLAPYKKNFDVSKESDKTSRLVNVIANELRREQPLAEKLNELKSTTGVVEVDKGEEEILNVEEFSARELARIDLNSLGKRANLSSQEAELHEYLSRFPDAVTSDIANHLGVKANTAGVAKRNWKRKLRRAANLK